ncbi:unannotated protein [freshwater metagenome]|uniref:Unannotated protein n=1 Tax=freshwater metagenome TaxID=449393 RepID=A0A6J7E1G7_9ZZZZ
MHRTRVLDRRTHVEPPAEQQRGNVRQRPRGRLCERLAGEQQAVLHETARADGRRRPGHVARRIDGSDRRVDARAAPVECARQGVGQRRVQTAGDDVQSEAQRRGRNDRPVANGNQAQQRRVITLRSCGEHPRQARLHVRVQVRPGDQCEELLLGRNPRRAPSGGRIEAHAGDRAAAQARRDGPEVSNRITRDPAAAAGRALLTQHSRQAREGVEQERIRSVGPDDRIEDQPVDMRRVAARVLLRDPGPVADSSERDPPDAQRDAQRLDVLNAVERAVEGCTRANAAHAARNHLGRHGIETAQALDRRAAQRS